MPTKIYLEKAQNLSKAIDIAIDVVKKNPPKGFDQSLIDHFTKTYLESKNMALNPEPKYANTKSLSYIINDVFIYFQEGSGDDVNIFWKEIKKAGLPYKRENKMDKIFKRKRIKNQVEYDFVIDTMMPYKELGLLDNADIIVLNKFIGDFEQRYKQK